MNQDKWTQQLHDKLAEHETAAPDGLWDDIEAALAGVGGGVEGDLQSPIPAGAGAGPVPARSRARFVPLRRWAAAAAVTALLVVGGLLYYNDVEQNEAGSRLAAVQNEPPTSEEGPLTAQQEQDEQQEQEGQTSPEEPPVLMAKEEQTRQAVRKEQGEPLTAETLPEKPHVDDGHADRDETPAETQAGVSPEGAADNAATPSGTATPEPSEAWKRREHRTARTRRQPSLGLYAMNSLGTKDNSNAVMMADALAHNYTSALEEATAASARRKAPIFLTGYEEQQHHYQPLAFGLTLDYPLTNHLSITSGVVYTRLRSDFTQIIHSQHISREQTLHYVGIPLSLTCRLWQQGAFRAYVAAGVQADWNVAARQDAEGVEQHIGRDRMQWSANASVGVQYNILSRVALYAEPGVNHYFDNGSPLQNFFKDKPTSLKLQMGLRLQLP